MSVDSFKSKISSVFSSTKDMETKTMNIEKDKNLDIAIRFIRTIADLNFTDNDIRELRNNAPLQLLSNMARNVLKKIEKINEIDTNIEDNFYDKKD